MPNAWRFFEELPGLTAVPLVWRRGMQEDFEQFKILCLQPGPNPVQSFPCPLRTSCAYRILPNPASPTNPPSTDPLIQALFAGHCQRAPPVCPQRQLTANDITPLQLNWPKLARAICSAFGLDHKTAKFAVPNTIQVGSWSADAVPVILTIQTERHHLRLVICELIARLHRKFILLAPTTKHFDATCQELLVNAGAGFFALECHVTLTDHGTLVSRTTPGVLFASFRPEPKDPVGEDVARQALALAKALDSECRVRKAPVYTVFLLYCAEGLSPAEIARECHCTKGLIFIRLRWLRAKLGRHPAELRQYSAHFESIEESLCDPRARKIHRREQFMATTPQRSLRINSIDPR